MLCSHRLPRNPIYFAQAQASWTAWVWPGAQWQMINAQTSKTWPRSFLSCHHPQHSQSRMLSQWPQNWAETDPTVDGIIIMISGICYWQSLPWSLTFWSSSHLGPNFGFNMSASLHFLGASCMWEEVNSLCFSISSNLTGLGLDVRKGNLFQD